MVMYRRPLHTFRIDQRPKFIIWTISLHCDWPIMCTQISTFEYFWVFFTVGIGHQPLSQLSYYMHIISENCWIKMKINKINFYYEKYLYFLILVQSNSECQLRSLSSERHAVRFHDWDLLITAKSRRWPQTWKRNIWPQSERIHQVKVKKHHAFHM